MNLTPLPFRSGLGQYRRQAQELLEAYRSGDSGAIRCINERHPRFLDEKIAWLPKNVSKAEVLGAGLDLDDLQLTLARWYDFRDWQALADYVAAVSRDNSAVCRFESAVEDVVTGDVASLAARLRENPELVHARSTRVTHFDPPVHRATLLHYVAANGVEGYRQKSPANAVEVAEILLRGGAEVDAVADLYGSQCTALSMLVSSSPPADAGVQAPLVDTLLDFGASVDGLGSGKWGTPLMTALIFGFPSAAEALARRGARTDNLIAAAGLGRVEDARQMLPAASAGERHRALSLAARYGHVEIVRLLLDAGEDPNRYNPDGFHSHTTPMHQAALAGKEAVVRLLVERGARLDILDTIYRSTPLGWAIHAEQTEIEKFLRANGG